MSSEREKKAASTETTKQWKQNTHWQKNHSHYSAHLFISVHVGFFLKKKMNIWQYNSEKQFVAQDTKITENEK